MNPVKIHLDNINMVIDCIGVVRPDSSGSPQGMTQDGGFITVAGGAILETQGGKCTDMETEEVRIFPAGVYELGPPDGIRKIGEIVATT